MPMADVLGSFMPKTALRTKENSYDLYTSSVYKPSWRRCVEVLAQVDGKTVLGKAGKQLVTAFHLN